MRSYQLAVMLIFCSATATAEEFQGVRPLGMGGANRAVANGNDAIVFNPAGMSLFPHYSFEANYLFTPKYGSEDGPADHVINVSVVDNQTQGFATGLAYTRVQREGDANKTGNRFDLALSVPLSDIFLLGANVKYLNFDRNGKKNAVDAVSVDMGALLRTSFGLNIGVAGYNLTNTGDYLEHPISMAAGLSYSPFRTLDIAFDWFIDFQKPKDPASPEKDLGKGYSYHFGLEYLLLDQITFRAGFLVDQINPQGNDQYWSAGIGYITQVMALDFGYRGSVRHGWGGTFGFGLRLFLQ